MERSVGLGSASPDRADARSGRLEWLHSTVRSQASRSRRWRAAIPIAMAARRVAGRSAERPPDARRWTGKGAAAPLRCAPRQVRLPVLRVLASLALLLAMPGCRRKPWVPPPPPPAATSSIVWQARTAEYRYTL